MKYIIILLALIVLSGCNEEFSTPAVVAHVNNTCEWNYYRTEGVYSNLTNNASEKTYDLRIICKNGNTILTRFVTTE